MEVFILWRPEALGPLVPRLNSALAFGRCPLRARLTQETQFLLSHLVPFILCFQLKHCFRVNDNVLIDSDA